MSKIQEALRKMQGGSRSRRLQGVDPAETIPVAKLVLDETVILDDEDHLRTRKSPLYSSFYVKPMN